MQLIGQVALVMLLSKGGNAIVSDFPFELKHDENESRMKVKVMFKFYFLRIDSQIQLECDMRNFRVFDKAM